MLDLRPALAPFETAFARPTTVTPAGGVAVAVSVIWDQEPVSPDAMNPGAAATTNARLIAYVRRDAVPRLPPGSLIVGGPEHQQKTWRVQSVDESDPDYHKAVVT